MPVERWTAGSAKHVARNRVLSLLFCMLPCSAGGNSICGGVSYGSGLIIHGDSTAVRARNDGADSANVQLGEVKHWRKVGWRLKDFVFRIDPADCKETHHHAFKEVTLERMMDQRYTEQ